MSQQRKGILFDLDGTLWDSSAAVAEAWSQQLSKEGYDQTITAEQMRSVMGLSMDQVAARLLHFIPAALRPEVARRCEQFENQYLAAHPGTLYPHLASVLNALQEAGYSLAVVSNCQQGYIEAFYTGSQLGSCFCDQECYGRTLLPKSANIQQVVERNLLDWACYVGDTSMDAQAAQQAGLPFVHAAYGFGQVDQVPAIQGLDALLPMVEQLQTPREGME